MDQFIEPVTTQVKMPEMSIVREYVTTFFQAFNAEEIVSFLSSLDGFYFVNETVNTSPLMRKMVEVSKDQVDQILIDLGIFDQVHALVEA